LQTWQNSAILQGDRPILCQTCLSRPSLDRPIPCQTWRNSAIFQCDRPTPCHHGTHPSRAKPLPHLGPIILLHQNYIASSLSIHSWSIEFTYILATACRYSDNNDNNSSVRCDKM
jgi:hypothetical protein